MSKKKPSPQQKPVQKKRTSLYAKVTLIIVVAALVIFLAISNLLKKNETDTEYMFRKDGTLTFLNDSSQVKAKIDIQIANTEFDRELGLMFRKSMKENQGMLFIFPVDTIQTFWMRNTYIPLDMVFINSQKTIVSISKNTKVLSDQTYASKGPAQYVLEVNAGYCDKFNINPGDKVNWKKSQNTIEK